MNDFIKISFPGLQPEQKDILIAQLSDAGFEGFEEVADDLNAFIPADKYDGELLHELLFKYQLPYNHELIKEVNWNQLWESSYEPVVVDDFCRISASFHPPGTLETYQIVITPKMSFGTGHHATTYMMIQQMRNLEFREKRVCDFGTGTGILSILAEQMGAKEIIAIDNDSWSIANARENIGMNNCSHIKLINSSVIDIKGSFDVIFANINRNVIIEHINSLNQKLARGGVLIISGILRSDEDELMKICSKYGLQSENRLEKNDWLSMRFVKPN